VKPLLEREEDHELKMEMEMDVYVDVRKGLGGEKIFV